MTGMTFGPDRVRHGTVFVPKLDLFWGASTLIRDKMVQYRTNPLFASLYEFQFSNPYATY